MGHGCSACPRSCPDGAEAAPPPSSQHPPQNTPLRQDCSDQRACSPTFPPQPPPCLKKAIKHPSKDPSTQVPERAGRPPRSTRSHAHLACHCALRVAQTPTRAKTCGIRDQKPSGMSERRRWMAAGCMSFTAAVRTHDWLRGWGGAWRSGRPVPLRPAPLPPVRTGGAPPIH